MFDQDSDEMCEDDSGSDIVDSSDDDLDVMLHGTPEQKRKLQHHSTTPQQTQSEHGEDDFEREMNAELSKALRSMEQRRWTTNMTNSKQTDEGATLEDRKKKSVQFYDDVYFDSDEDEKADEQTQKNADGAKLEHRRLTDDELLYDPNMDDDDQNWVNAQRQRYQPQHHGNVRNQRKAGTGGQKRQTADRRGVQPLPNSDAMLDCPACMTTLCTDCQQHSLYKNQYRAMFVTNCIVDNTEKLSYPKNTGKKNKKRKHLSKKSGNSDMSMNEQYRQMTSQIDPSVTSQIDPSVTSQIDPSMTSQIDPSVTSQIDPSVTSQIDPSLTSPIELSITSQMNTSKHAENGPAKDDFANSVIENSVKSDSPVGALGSNDNANVASVSDSSVQTNMPNVKATGTVGSPGDGVSVFPTGQKNTEVKVESSGLDVNDEDIYHPVKCSECNTVVAVFDSDEVYHFFNVLTSYG